MCITKNVFVQKEVEYFKSSDSWDLTKLLKIIPHASLVEGGKEAHRNMLIDILDKRL